MTDEQLNQEIDPMTADAVKEFLRKGPTDVTFIKKNGELRRGVFTLQEELIPEDKRPKNVRTPSENEVNGDIVRAYDTELEAFRTITVPNIVAIYTTKQ